MSEFEPSLLEKVDLPYFSHIWNEYLTFESYCRNKGDSLSAFLVEWNKKMSIAQSAGFQYSDIVLACKLLEKANLGKTDIELIVGSVDNSCLGILANMLTRLEAHNVMEEMWEKNPLDDITHEYSEGKPSEAHIKEESGDLAARLAQEGDLPLSAATHRKKGVRRNATPLCPKCNNSLDTVLLNHKGRSKKAQMVCEHCDFVMHLSKTSTKKVPFATSAKANATGRAYRYSIDVPDLVKVEGNLENPPSFMDVKFADLSDDEGSPEIPDPDPFFPPLEKKKKELKYKCEFCGKLFDRFSRLKIHSVKVHGIEPPPPSQKENENNAKDGEVKVKKKKPPAKDIPSQCELCGKKYSRKQRLKQHYIKAHNPAREGKEAEDRPKKHKGPITCKYCGKVFARLANYKIHEPIHTGEKNYKCDVCSKAFTHYNYLVYHKMRHRGDRPFKCDQCPKTFLTSSNLRAHLRREHLMERPFQCEQCSYSTPDKAHLKRHIMSHTGERPYKCSICDKTFRDTRSRKRHVMSQHSEPNMNGMGMPDHHVPLLQAPPDFKVKAEGMENFGHS